MFGIYKEATYSGRYKLVYFTELQDHNQEFEISRALSGEQMFDGFTCGYRKEEAEQEIQKIIERLNAGEALDRGEIERKLAPFMPAPAG